MGQTPSRGSSAAGGANAAVGGHKFDRLYWTQDTPPADDGAARPHRKRWRKVMRQHSGLQLVEVMEDKMRKSLSLYLDRALQLTDLGEHMYHEMMAHTPLMTTTAPPRDVLVLGAGDGGVALRVLMHPSVQRVVQVELDEAVVNTSRHFFPDLAAAFDDPRMDLRIEDAIAWVKREAPKAPGSFDACIIDSTDEPLMSIWSPEFFSAVRRLLRPGGVLMQNIQSLDVPVQLDNMLGLHTAGGFERVRAVLISTVDYGSPYVAYMSSGLETVCPGPALDAEERAAPLKAAWYSPTVHRASLVVPPAMVRRWPEFAENASSCGPLSVLAPGAAPPAPLQRQPAPPPPPPPGPAAPSSAVERPPAGEAGAAAESDEGVVDVAVIGGGLAGIAAAHVLSRHLGVSKVMVFEARSKVGGRIEATDPNTFGGVSANLGANWIHFASRNPVLRLAERLGCPTGSSANGNMQWFARGLGRLPASAIEEARAFAASLAEHLEAEEGEVAPGTSAAEQLRRLAGGAAEAPDAATNAARQLHFFADVVQDHTAFPGDISAARLCAGICGGDSLSQDRHLTGERGAECLLRGLMAEFPSGRVEVRPGHVVRALRRLPGPRPLLEVSFLAPARGGRAAPRLESVRARVAVLTVPLGVLQASIATDDGETCSNHLCAASSLPASPPGDEGLVEFDPPLPPARVRRWSRLGVGQSLRAALLFEEPFWDPKVDFFAYLLNASADSTGSRPAGGLFYGEAPAVEFTNLMLTTGRAVLGAEVGRHLADQLQGRSNAEIGQFLLEQALRPMFPGTSVPPPSAVAVKRFGADPYLRGALSFPAVAEELSEMFANEAPSSEGEDRARFPDLWSPLWGGQLVFAGEHTSLRLGTLDGALFSGIQAAWNAACTLRGGSTPLPLDPLELIRAIGIFGDWFPHAERTRRCLDKFALSWRRAGHGSGQGPAGGEPTPCWASPRWLEELEAACREQPPEAVANASRHCLDQGD